MVRLYTHSLWFCRYLQQYLFSTKCKTFCFQNMGGDMDSAPKSSLRCTECPKQDAGWGRYLCTAPSSAATNSVGAYAWISSYYRTEQLCDCLMCKSHPDPEIVFLSHTFHKRYYQTGLLCKIGCCRKIRCFTFFQNMATVKRAISSSTCFSVVQHFGIVIHILWVCTVSITVVWEMLLFHQIKAVSVCLKIYWVWARLISIWNEI